MSDATDMENTKPSDTANDVTTEQPDTANDMTSEQLVPVEGTESVETAVLPQLSEVSQTGKEDEAKMLMDLVEDKIYFHDETRQPYAQIGSNGHTEIMAVKGDEFKSWLSYQFFLKYKESISLSALKRTVNTLVGRALYAGERHHLHLRVAPLAGNIWYDLANDNYQSVRITPRGWTVENNPPIIFQRNRKSGEQVMPERDGDVKSLLSFVNIPDPEQQCLLLTYLVYCFVPSVPKPPAHLNGEKGSGKTTLSRIIKSMVDPSTIDTVSLPNHKDELMLQLAQMYMPVYDNQVALTQWQSDVMCSAATGGGMAKRELYTNSGEIIFRFIRPVIMNGINDVALNSDLLDRCIVFEQERIPDNTRITEENFWKRFKEQQPKILGGIFDTLSQAMQIYPSVRLQTLPRMADFAKWGYAIAQAMGYEPQVFLNAYDQNIRSTNQVAIENHPLAQTLLRLMQAYPIGLEATAGNLLKNLEKTAENEGIRTGDKQFPKTPAVLVRRLKEVKSNLREEGFDYAVTRDARNNSVVSISRIRTRETTA